MKAAGINVIERVPLIVGRNPSNAHYLDTKADKMGHLLFSKPTIKNSPKGVGSFASAIRLNFIIFDS